MLPPLLTNRILGCLEEMIALEALVAAASIRSMPSLLMITKSTMTDDKPTNIDALLDEEKYELNNPLLDY